MVPTTYASTYEVGPGATYSTIKAAADAVAKDQAKELGITGGGPAVAQAAPWRRRRILVRKGTYPEGPLALPTFTDLVGATGDPADVIITATGTNNVIGTGGRSCYLAHITFRQTSDSPIAHPMNDSGYAGDAGLGPRQVRTVVVDHCVMDCDRSGLAGKGAVDLTPGPGTTMIFNRVSFLSPGQPQAISCVVGTGTGSNLTSVMFIDSHVQANYERHADPGIAGSGEGPSFPVGLVQAGGSARHDSLVWAGGTWDIAKGGPKTGIGALLACGYDQKNAKESAATWYLIQFGSQAGTKSSWLVPGTKVKTSLPGSMTLPSGGTSAQELAFYGKKPTHEQTAIATGKSSARLTVAAGSVYWVALDLAGQAVFSRGVRVGGAISKFAAGVALDDKGRPIEDANGLATGPGVGTTTDTAAVTGRWFYPGQGPIWVGMAFAESASVPAMVSSAGKAFIGSGYTAGSPMPSPSGDLKEAPSGMLVPALSLLSALPDSYPA